MINDYNAKLMQALNSVFWYDGLLEQEGDEWVDFAHLSRPKYDKNCVILQLIDELRHKNTKYDFYTLDDALELCDEFRSPREFNVIWMILVEMFGSCGTSPRTGWIEKREKCADFLEQIVEIEERLYNEVNDEED